MENVCVICFEIVSLDNINMCRRNFDRAKLKVITMTSTWLNFIQVNMASGYPRF